MSVKITKETLKNGKVRYRARGVSTGIDPATGKRTQTTITGSSEREVEKAVAKIVTKVDSGTYHKPWNGTVNEIIDAYLTSKKVRGLADNTRLSYEKALLPARDRLGHRKARSITREDVERLLDWMEESGRRRGGKPGTGLGSRSVRLTFGRLSAAMELACRDRKLNHNPCTYADQPRLVKRDVTAWDEHELERFRVALGGHRLRACFLLSALGLRREEILGLRWSDIDRDAGTVTIARARVLVDYRVIEKEPKSEKSARKLPFLLPPPPDAPEPLTVVARLIADLPAALDELNTIQQAEMERAGEAYENSGYIASDELGRPMNPEHYSDAFRKLAKAAGLPRIRLHDTRATMNSILERAGMPDTARAFILGHTVEVNRGSYLAVPVLTTIFG